MTLALQWIRSLVFVIQMYLVMVLAGIVFLPWALVSRQGAYRGVHLYCRYIRVTLRLICGLRTEIRGTVPTDEVLIGAKHQSFLDIILLCSVLPRPKFIMKASLRHAPVLGWYARRIGCVPVERGRRAEAIRAMMAEVTAGDAPAGQLVIYPQGTRVAPGVFVPYKVGVAAIYAETGQTCVPAATNVGLFWPRQGVLRRPGLAVVEFLPPIPPGLSRDAFRERLQAEVEMRSEALMREGGFTPHGLPQSELSRHDRGA